MDKYYQDFYTKVQRRGVQGWGNSLIDRLIAKNHSRFIGQKILEVGAGSGEHIKFEKSEPTWREYCALDLFPGVSDPDLYQSLITPPPPPCSPSTSFFPMSASNGIERTNIDKKVGDIRFLKGDVMNLPFLDSSFDSTISTCLFAHISDPEKGLAEIRRVTKSGGEIVIAFPCDPGMLNRFIKFFITFPLMKKAGIGNPRLNYAREHINSIHNLKILLEEVFREDKLRLTWFPFRLPFWNFELVLLAKIKVIKN